MIFNYDGEQRKKGAAVYANEKDVCTFLKDHDDMYAPIAQASNLPAEYVCPFPKVKLISIAIFVRCMFYSIV